MNWNAHFGDSYDVVKRFMLRSIAPSADWTAFPMFSDGVNAEQIKVYESLIGVAVSVATS